MFCTTFDPVKSGCVIIGYDLKIYKIDFVYANSVDPDEMLRSAAFHLDIYCLPKDPLRDL